VERRTGEISGKDYIVIRTEPELRVEPVEVPMVEGKWYEPILEKAREIIERVKGSYTT